MFNLIKSIFWPPVFENDEEKSRTAVNLNALLWASLTLLIILRISTYIGDPEATAPGFLTNPITILVGVLALLLVVMRVGFIREASFLMLIAAWGAFAFEAHSFGGVYDTAFIGNIVLILLAGLLLGTRASLFFAVLAVLTGWGLNFFQTADIKIDTAQNFTRDMTVVFILVAIVSYLTINGLRNALKRSSANQADLLRSNQQLLALRADLEKRVTERTIELQKRSTELESISASSQQRAVQLQAVAQVGRAITSIQSLQSLLPRIAGVIGKQFSYYHVGIFLLDDAKQYAILSATNSAGGQKMLSRGHRLQVGQVGIVGYAAQMGSPRIASDTGSDATYFNNPDLPDTRSEMAIPLYISNEIIGILDLQSEKPSAFGQQDIELLTIVADQVAIAIQNARRFQSAQQASQEAETLYGASVSKQWVAYASNRESAGYQFSGTTIKPIDQKVETPNTRQAIQNKAPSFSQEKTNSSLAVPIQLRGQVIGLLNIEVQGQRAWNQDEIDITSAIAERVSLAIENARLLQEAQTRATKERVIGDIAAKLSSSNDMDNIFQIAARELGQVMPDAQVVVQFLPDQDLDE